MIQIRVLNHEEAAKSQGGLRGLIGLGLNKLGLMDLRARVEEQIAKQIRDELQKKGVRVELVVFDEAVAPPGELPPRADGVA
jgi:hypothetical protein